MAKFHGPSVFAAALLLLPVAMAVTQPPSAESPPPPPVVVACSDEVRACWARGELWVSGACHTPLEQGPCPDAQWLVLDALALPKGTCAPRPCPPAQLPSRGRCLEEAEAREMCWSGAVHLNASGGLCCGASPGWSAVLEAHVRCEAMDHATTDAYSLAAHTYDYNSTDDGYTATDSDFKSTHVIALRRNYFMRGKSGKNIQNDSSYAYIIHSTNVSLTNASSTVLNFTDSFSSESHNSNIVNALSSAGVQYAVVTPVLVCAREDNGSCVPHVYASAPLPVCSVYALAIGALGALVMLRRSH